MKIAIVGTRGIPNYYGGFEQFAQYLSKGLVDKGHDVTVYNSHNHPYQDSEWNGVKISHQYDPEHMIGTAGQFIYDLKCILHLRNKDFDIVLQLGYTSSSIWSKFMPNNSAIVTNMDGLEWKRSKFSKAVQKFLLYAEKWAVFNSDVLVADSLGIKDYLGEKYGVKSTYIPYGATIFSNPDFASIKELNLTENKYNILIARLEPENSIEIILDGVAESSVDMPFLVVGNYCTQYGEYLQDKYKTQSHIRFLGGIYDIEKLNNLRYYSNIYFHGHTVGGTNPSLLEAMASSAFICANDNSFNRYILGDDAIYFKESKDVAFAIENKNSLDYTILINNNTKKIKETYPWQNIINQYERLFIDIINK